MRYIAFFIFLLSSIQSYSQEPAHYVLGKDIFDGVHLYSIIQDDTDNSMWITSNKGIYNYNGISFTHHTPKNSKSSALFGLTKDNEGNIFCFNLNGQIFKLHNKKIELYYTITKPKAKSIYSIVFDNKNNLFIASQGGNFTVLSNNTKNDIDCNDYKNFPVKHNDTLYYFKQSKDYKNNNLIKRYDNNEVITSSYKSYFQLFFIENKIYSYDYNTNKIYQLINGTTIPLHNFGFLSKKTLSTIFNIGNHIWICSATKGAYRIPKNEFETRKKHNELFKEYIISGGTKDNEGTTWLLTFNKGIINIPNLKNTVIKSPNNSDFKAITKTDKQLYIATENGQIYKLNQHKFFPFFKLDKGDRVEHLKVFPKQKCIISSEKIYTNNLSKKIAFCRDAVLLKDSLVLGLAHNLESYHLQTKQTIGFSAGRIYNIYYDTITKKTWFTTNNGLKQYKNGKTSNITHQGKEILKAKTLAVNNQIWVASKNGVYIFKNDSVVQHITQKDGLLTNDIDNIKYEQPNIYLASKKGIQRYNISSQTFTDFTFSDGLTKRIAQFEVLNDTVYAINSDGLLTFTFENKDKNIKPYKTYITKAIANGTTQINNNSSLEANENNLHFSFLTTTFKHQKELKYQYQLIGIDKKPIKAIENQFSANYGNVPAGNYTFRVDSFLGDTKNQSATLHFSIKEVWYKALWLRWLVIGAILLMLYYIYKVRLNALIRKRDKEKMQKQLAESTLTSLKAQMNPHFMFNAMNSIQSLILEGNKYEAYEYLTQLSNFVRKNLDMSDVSFIPFEQEVNFLKMYLELEKIRFQDSLTYTIDNNVKSNPINIPSMIIQPFVENAIKHGLLHKKTNRNLSIEFAEQPNLIICYIIDNGVGREASKKINEENNTNKKSFSTAAIKNRFKILQSYYKLDLGFEYEDLVKDKLPVGTKVTIKIPYTKND